jgi:hypothetical protein
MLQLFQRHVTSVYFECFRCLKYISSVFSRRMLQVCLSGCYICFTQTLHVLYLDVVCVWLQWFSKCFQVFFFQVFQKHVSSILTAFRRMLQLLYLDVSKVDWVLHLPPHLLLYRLSWRRQGIHRTPWQGPFESDALSVLPLLSLKRHRPCVERETEYSARASIRTLAPPINQTN